jgi:plasmid replication initiation protein
MEVCRKTPVYELNKFRSQLGIGVNEYIRMEAFKRRVLDIAVDQINELSDITVKYEQHKKVVQFQDFLLALSQRKQLFDL